MDFYFIVDVASDVILSVVQRNKKPAQVAGKKFVKATGIQMTFFNRLSTSQSEVTLEQVLKY